MSRIVLRDGFAFIFEPKSETDRGLGRFVTNDEILDIAENSPGDVKVECCEPFPTTDQYDLLWRLPAYVPIRSIPQGPMRFSTRETQHYFMYMKSTLVPVVSRQVLEGHPAARAFKLLEYLGGSQLALRQLVPLLGDLFYPYSIGWVHAEHLDGPDRDSTDIVTLAVNHLFIYANRFKHLPWHAVSETTAFCHNQFDSHSSILLRAVFGEDFAGNIKKQSSLMSAAVNQCGTIGNGLVTVIGAALRIIMSSFAAKYIHSDMMFENHFALPGGDNLYELYMLKT